MKHNRILVDNEELDPFFNDILYAFAVEELYDTRIKANQTDTTQYEFQTVDSNFSVSLWLAARVRTKCL
ncbi:MAG TPA: hypothetical protein ACFYEL_07895 [Candidatus Wunengus californicus]|uniref:hypothetical protein n=1 Tax=Candidatus Wunengus californicus TaxID=3367619 RepID=UPI004024E2A3|nr:hypothetical protein [Planctomycetota bacterium]